MADAKEPVYAAEPVVQQQPQPVIATQPTYAPVMGTEDWQNDIFDCFEGPDNLCLKATFCPCFVFGKTQARRRDPTLANYERFNSDCLLWGGAQYCCAVGWVIQFLRRGEIRNEYSIKGDTLTDCVFSAFCHCCALIQQEKEVIGRQTQAGLVNNQGYVKQEGMSAGVVDNGKTQ